MVMMNLSWGIWSYFRFKRSLHYSMTPPITRSTSACLGEGSSFMPKQSISYFGVSKATTSTSQPLQAPELKLRIRDDLSLAQIPKPADFVRLSIKKSHDVVHICLSHGGMHLGMFESIHVSLVCMLTRFFSTYMVT